MVDAREWYVVELGSRRRDGSGVPTIRELIRAELDAGKSVRDLEADSGHRVKFQTFQELSNQPPRQFPKEVKTIQGMSAALHCTETAIVLAYAASLGIEVQGSDFALRLPPGVDALDSEMKSALVSVVRAATNQGVRHATQPATPADPPAEAPRTPGRPEQKTRAGDKPADLKPQDQASNVKPLRRRRGRDFTADPIIEEPWAADDRGDDDEGEAERARREQDERGDE